MPATSIFIAEGANAVSSFVMRSPKPANLVVPPDKAKLEKRSFLMPASRFVMGWKVVSWQPLAFLPTTFSWRRTSGSGRARC